MNKPKWECTLIYESGVKVSYGVKNKRHARELFETNPYVVEAMVYKNGKVNAHYVKMIHKQER